MFKPAAPLALTPKQKQMLESLARAGTTPQAVARKCTVLLLASQGVPNHAIAQQTGLSRPTVIATRADFAQGGIQAIRRLQKRKRSRRVLTPEVEQKILDTTLQTRPPGATHWSVRTLARHLGLTRTLVHGVWRRHGIQPRRVEKFQISQDPHFHEKVRDIVGLYLNPPDRTLVLCVDKESQIHGRDPTDPFFPLWAGLPEPTHDYRRHGTTTLFAAFNILNGKVIGTGLPLQRAKEFIQLLHQLEKQAPADLEIHVILDGSGTLDLPALERWLKPKKRRRFHCCFIPTSPGWLDQVERFFGLITDGRIRQGKFHGVAELEDAIYQWLAIWSQKARPFEWRATTVDKV
jgi:transposase